MKNRVFMIAVVMSAIFCLPTSGLIENSGISNPIGSSTIPPSTFDNSLINSPSPIDMDGNLLITGNVRRGRQFRGDVPYRSPSSFGSSLGTSTLSSFLRDTAGPEDLNTYSNKYGTQPYYSPTETVTTMMPGRSEIFMPERTRVGVRMQQDTRLEAANVFGLDSMAREQALFSQGSTAVLSDLKRPATPYGPLAQSRLMLESRFPTNMSLTQKGTELFSPAQLGVHKREETPSAELFTEQVQNVVDRTQSSTTVQSPRLHEGQLEKNESLNSPNQEMNNESLRPSFEMKTSGQSRDEDGKRNALTHQSSSSLEKFPTSMDSMSQNKLFLQEGTNWSNTSEQFKSGREQASAISLDKTKNVVSGLTGTGQDLEQSDVLERIRQQLEDLTKSLDAATQSQRLLTEGHDEYKYVNTDQVAKQQEATSGYQPYVPDSHQAVRRDRIDSSGSLGYYGPQGAKLGFNPEDLAPTAEKELNRTDISMKTGLEFEGTPNYRNSEKISSPLDELNKLSQAEISAEANRILGRHKSIESLSETKFNQYMHDAETHLMEGRYYRAASSFSLASIYQPDNPLALAGRGHALFAAGEYVSSALFLSRALTINPNYLRMRVDLGALLGDKTKLAERIEDVKQWLARSGSSQLQFLLGYVYYRTGQLLEAKKVIDTAYEKTPESQAVRAMKITIDNMMMHR